jgi:hypothetical protein
MKTFFIILRYLILIIGLRFGFSYVKRKSNKKIWRVLLSILVFAITIIVICLPYENVILHFDTAKEAFDYENSKGRITDIFEFEKCAIVLFEDGDINTANFTYYEKPDKFWISRFMDFSTDFRAFLFIDSKYLSRIEATTNFCKASNQYTIVILDREPEYKTVISDKIGTPFSENLIKFENGQTRKSYAKLIDENTKYYTFEVNGEKFEIKLK